MAQQKRSGRKTTRAGDFTGTKKAELTAQHAEEQEARAASMSLATAKAKEEQKEPEDLKPIESDAPANKGPVEAKTVEQQEGDDVAATKSVDVEEPMKTFRVNETLEMVTIGHGNNYNFEEGREYRAPKHVYDHLEEKGLIWH